MACSCYARHATQLQRSGRTVERQPLYYMAAGWTLDDWGTQAKMKKKTSCVVVKNFHKTIRVSLLQGWLEHILECGVTNNWDKAEASQSRFFSIGRKAVSWLVAKTRKLCCFRQNRLPVFAVFLATEKSVVTTWRDGAEETLTSCTYCVLISIHSEDSEDEALVNIWLAILCMVGVFPTGLSSWDI